MYDEKLREIMIKYGVRIVKEEELNDNLDLSVKGILTEHCAGKKCALWGAGRMNTTSSHAAILIGKYATYLQDLVCVIDSEPSFQGKSFLGHPVILPEEIHNYDIDIVIIASKNSGDSIISSLLAVSPESAYVEIYTELRKKGIEVYNTFFDERSIYTILFDLQQKLIEVDQKEKKEILIQLITLYLNIRDFHYAFTYIDLYCSYEFDHTHQMSNLKYEVEQLLVEMKQIISLKEEDVSLLYIDALRYIDLFDGRSEDSKYLKQYTQHASIYHNMYSVGATTYESMVSTMLGHYPLECDVYQDNFLRDFDEVELLKNVTEDGYQINWMVSDCYRLLNDDNRLSFDIQIYMSKKLWNLTCVLAEEKQKTFNFVYFPYEIHCPMLCGYHKNKPVIRGFSNIGIEAFPDSLAEQYLECLDYMDQQFDFYYELLGRNTKKIIFSDHAQVVYDEDNQGKSYNMYYKFKDFTTHIPFILSKEDMEHTQEYGFYSMVDFNHIIDGLIKDKGIVDYQKEIIRYQYYPIHSAKIRLHCQSMGHDDYIEGLDIFASKDYIYIKTGTGKEEIYTYDDMNKNIIDTPQGQAYQSQLFDQYESSL